MSKGPKINYKKDRRFTTRDNLGIEGAGASLQAELCPLVNTVTPRAFYWIFMVWNYYDFYQNSGVDKDKWNVDYFDKDFLKKNDYYFVLGNLLNEGSDRQNLVGIDNTGNDISNNKKGPYAYNRNYFKTRYGGMQYYNAGCLTLGYITDRDAEGNEFKFPRLTEEEGKPLALAFEKVIKDTRYFKEYRLKDTAIPRDVLEELGKIVSLDLKSFDECKSILRNSLFDPKRTILFDNTNLIASADYIKFLVKEHGLDSPNAKRMREILFEYYSPSGNKKPYPDELRQVVQGWECVMGRQYLVVGIELIWKYLVGVLVKPLTIEDWINTAINEAVWSWDINEKLCKYINECKFSFPEREDLISQGYRESKNISKNVENGIKILISMYNWFLNRKDLDDHLLKIGDEEISINTLISLVERYRDCPVHEFVSYIMANWIIKRHQWVAFNKMVQGRDGYYFEYNDGLFSSKGIMPSPNFQGIRLIQLMQVMKDLGMV